MVCVRPAEPRELGPSRFLERESWEGKLRPFEYTRLDNTYDPYTPPHISANIEESQTVTLSDPAVNRASHTMASTTPQGPSLTTIALATTGVILSASVAYALYFDHKRRSDPEFRRQLKRQHKKISKEESLSAQAAERSQKERIKKVVDQANEDGFPRDPEETEQYFMQEVARGETMCTDGSDPVDAALCFYKALKVYPQPRELIGIYDKTVPKVS